MLTARTYLRATVPGVVYLGHLINTFGENISSPKYCRTLIILTINKPIVCRDNVDRISVFYDLLLIVTSNQRKFVAFCLFSSDNQTVYFPFACGWRCDVITHLYDLNDAIAFTYHKIGFARLFLQVKYILIQWLCAPEKFDIYDTLQTEAKIVADKSVLSVVIFLDSICPC